MASIRFVRVLKEYLDTIDIIDGQIIYTRDSGDLYKDEGSIRSKITDVVSVPNITLEGNGLPGKLYFNFSDKFIYVWDAAEERYTKANPLDVSDKMDKVVSAVESNIAIFDSNGQVIDSGSSIADITPEWIEGDNA